MKINFKKKGIEFQVTEGESFLENLKKSICYGYSPGVILKVQDKWAYVSPCKIRSDWGYLIEDLVILETLKLDTNRHHSVFITHSSAKKVYKWLEKQKNEYIKRKQKEPLEFEVEEITYSAMDMSMRDVVLSPSKEMEFWTEKENEIVNFAAKLLHRTNALNDDRLSVIDIDTFKAGDRLTTFELKEKLEKMLIDEIMELKEGEMAIRKEEARMKRFHEKYKITVKYELKHPHGRDHGYADFALRNKETGKVIRVVASNVFDFGFYTYPKRVEGTDDVFNKNRWSEEEKEACKWMKEFPPFSTLLRM